MATELGKAYVQIIPSAKGISGSIQKTLSPEAEVAGKSAGSTIARTIKRAITVAAIGKVIAESLKEGAALEQSLGGVETLFKNSADKVIANANNAYKTAGLSANAYMENVTSFSASLLQSVAGDTKKAADIADMAMVDMSDNANKFGTNMQDIQNAYQGFAKQNYTMLDNLKLGYGGTKTEMERLLKDAQAFSGVEYNIDSLADVYEAIHVIQEEMGVAGTTAIEASETFSGSFASMKAALQNALGSLALGENIGPSLQGLADSTATFLFGNFIPMVVTIISSLPSAIGTFLTAAVPQFIEMGSQLLGQLTEGIITGIPMFMERLNEITLSMQTWVQTQLPMLIQNGVDWIVGLATGMMNSLPSVISSMSEILINILSSIMDAAPSILQGGFDLITGLAKGILDNLPAVGEAITKILENLLELIVDKGPDIIRKGFELIGKLAKGLWDNLPQIISTISSIIANLIAKIGSYLPQFIAKGLELIGRLAIGLIKALPDVLSKGGQIITSLLGAIGKFIGSFASIGFDLIRGLWNGIGNAKDWILGKISGFVDSIIGGIKRFFGIRSPSTVFAKIGEQLDEGLAKGIEGGTKPITQAMEDVAKITTRSFESEVAINAAPGSLKGISASLEAGARSEDKKAVQPAYFTFNFAGHRFQAFVDDITKLQNRDIELELAY